VKILGIFVSTYKHSVLAKRWDNVYLMTKITLLFVRIWPFMTSFANSTIPPKQSRLTDWVGEVSQAVTRLAIARLICKLMNINIVLFIDITSRVLVKCRISYVTSTTSFYQAFVTQSQLVWASGICCCRPNCLELTERWSAWSGA